MLNIMLLSLRSVSLLTSRKIFSTGYDCFIRVYLLDSKIALLGIVTVLLEYIDHNFPYFLYYTSILLDAFVVMEDKGKLCM